MVASFEDFLELLTDDDPRAMQPTRRYGRDWVVARQRLPQPALKRFLTQIPQQMLCNPPPSDAGPPHSEPGRQSFGDRDGAESWATVRTNRDSFETASTSHQHMQERSMSDCSDRDDRQPVLTGDQTSMLMLLPLVLRLL